MASVVGRSVDISLLAEIELLTSRKSDMRMYYLQRWRVR
jgi:hypothetical protein